MIEVVVDSVRVSLINQQQRLVVLREIRGPRYLPIWIGPFEAEAITMGLNRTEVGRPLTHDLLFGLVGHLGAVVERIVVSDLRDETFYARIVLNQDGQRIEVDSRPSDAIALAVRAEVPIFVADEVMDRAGQAIAEDEDEGAEGSDEDDDLRIFRDFIEELDLDLGDESDEHS